LPSECHLPSLIKGLIDAGQAILHVLNFDVMNLPHPQDVAHFGPPMARTVVVPKNRLALPELGVGPASRAPPSPGNKRKLSLLDLCT
jgi:hypothetical protein